MSNVPKSTPKSDPWLWVDAIYLIFGVIQVIVQPSKLTGWILLNISLFQFFSLVMTIPHELGHAIAARLMGINVTKIILGYGRTLCTFRCFDLMWEVKRIPIGGITLLSSVKSIHWYRSRFFLVVLCGPLTNFLLILLELQLYPELLLKNLPNTYLFPGLVFCLANTLAVAVNLFPHHVEIDGQKILSDGLQMLTIPFLSKRKIAQSVATAFVIEGQNWKRRGNYQQALESFSQAIRIDPNCGQAYYLKGKIYQSEDDYLNAVENFDQWSKVEPNAAAPYICKGMAYYDWRKLDPTKLQDAIEAFTKGISVQPSIHAYYYIRAACYSFLGNDQRAIEDFTRVIQLNPTAIAYYNRAVIYYQLRSFQPALEDFDQSIQLNDTFTSAYYGRGNTKYMLGDERGAFQDYQTAQSLSSKQPLDLKDEHGFYARGVALMRLEDNVGAVKDFQTAETLCSNNANLNLLRRIREKLQQLSEVSVSSST